MNYLIVPVQLRQLTGGRQQLALDLIKHVAETMTQGPQDKGSRGRTLGTLIQLAEIEAPGLISRILDTNGKLRNGIVVYVDSLDARTRMAKAYNQANPKSNGESPEERKATTDALDPLMLPLTGSEEITILPQR